MRLLERLLPGSCLLCGAMSRNDLLCQACVDDLPLTPEAHCPQCSERTTFGEYCGACLRHPPHFSRTIALYRYEFPVDRLIQQLKYSHQVAIARWSGHALAARLAPGTIDLILPVPLHQERLRQRGFNQSGEIAKALGRRLGLPVSHDLLMRREATAPQAMLPHDTRQENVRGVFECRGDLSGQRVLLVDDVMTTGATLRECSRVLHLHGAASIEVGVVARALRGTSAGPHTSERPLPQNV